MSQKKDLPVKFTAMIKRKNGISFEDFDKHWSQIHGPLVSSIPIFKEKVIKYNQIHLDIPRMQQTAESNALPIYNDFDGVAELYAESWEDLMAVFGSDDYRNIVMPDEQKFIQSDQCKVFFSYNEVHFQRDDIPASSSSS